MTTDAIFFRSALRPLLASALLSSCAALTQDLPSLPEYTPGQQVAGTLRSWGNDHMAGLLKNWEEGFARYQPGIRFRDRLKGTASAQYGLQEWVADVALMGRQMWQYEYYGTYRRSLMYPVEIGVATGSFDVPHKSFALAVFVHKDNPLTRLTLGQLDRIFGAERQGGWQGLEWHEEVAKNAATNLRTWGQLGLTGDWANRPIHPYGPPLLAPGAVSYFQTRAMGGADTWNEDLREYEDRALLVREMSKDPCGIACAGHCYWIPDVKPLALAEKDGGPYVDLTRTTVADRAYPLTRTVYIYFTTDTKTGDRANPPVAPKVREFIRYILSRQGQEDVAREGDYLPLTPELVRENLKKLD
jgi:phosphate transport system substrate-binding protein